MEEDEDMFAPQTGSNGSGTQDSKSLFRVLSTGDSVTTKTRIYGEDEAMNSAAKSRFQKQNLANQQLSHKTHDADKRRAELYDEKDTADYEDDVDNLIDVTTMGTDYAPSRSKKSAKREEDEILPGERIEPANLIRELKRGEVSLYSEVRRKKRRNADDDDPNELAVPTNDRGPMTAKQKKEKAKKKRRRLGTGDSSESDSDDIDDGVDDDSENEALNAEDPWLAAVSKETEGTYRSKADQSATSSAAPTPAYLKDKTTALKEILQLLSEGPSGETVLRMIKRLTPNTGNRHKKAKKSSEATPNNTTEDHIAQEEVEKAKSKFEKVVAIADYLMDSGFTTVYESTYDGISNRLNPEKRKKDSAEENTKEINQGDDSTFWQYKWTLEDPNIYGPFDAESMKAWTPSFVQFTHMVVRGLESPAVAAKLGPGDGWVPFEPLLWS